LFNCGSCSEWPNQVVVAINRHGVLGREVVKLLGRPADVGGISIAPVPLHDLDHIVGSSNLHDFSS